MTSTAFWDLFCETGEPGFYLLYKEALLLESSEEKSA